MKKTITLWSGLSVALLACGLHGIAFAANVSPTRLDEATLKVLKQTHNLELAQPNLHATGYQSLGIPVRPALPALKNAVIQHETAHPTQATLPVKALKSCALMAVAIELDDVPTTLEWLLTPDNRCGGVSPYKAKTFWIIQKSGSQPPKVLLANRAYQVRIWQKNGNEGYRRVEAILKSTVPSRYTQKPLPVQCHLSWFGGGVQSVRPLVELYRDKKWVIIDEPDPYAVIDAQYQCPVK